MVRAEIKGREEEGGGRQWWKRIRKGTRRGWFDVGGGIGGGIEVVDGDGEGVGDRWEDLVEVFAESRRWSVKESRVS